jgi:hypothetical protein
LIEPLKPQSSIVTDQKNKTQAAAWASGEATISQSLFQSPAAGIGSMPTAKQALADTSP